MARDGTGLYSEDIAPPSLTGSGLGMRLVKTGNKEKRDRCGWSHDL